MRFCIAEWTIRNYNLWSGKLQANRYQYNWRILKCFRPDIFIQREGNIVREWIICPFTINKLWVFFLENCCHRKFQLKWQQENNRFKATHTFISTMQELGIISTDRSQAQKTAHSQVHAHKVFCLNVHFSFATVGMPTAAQRRKRVEQIEY